jgi:hypothetical protein
MHLIQAIYMLDIEAVHGHMARGYCCATMDLMLTQCVLTFSFKLTVAA